MPLLPNDPLFRYQWFLDNAGQSGGGRGSDINVLPVWPDYMGKGVRVAIVDDGVQLSHPDLAANIDVAGSWDAVTNSPGGDPVKEGQNHGTAVAGLVAAVANNGIGGSSVAPEATLLAYRIGLSDDWNQAYAVTAFEKALENRADIVNNSWGSGQAFTNNAQDKEQAAFFDALNALAVEGREGKGSIILFANGNDGRKEYDGNLDNVLNSRHVIAVGAVDDTGVRSAYSTPGANLLISAPGGASTEQLNTQPGNGVLTTDRTGSEGYNRLEGTAGNYDYNFSGTSAATPIVSGVVALMLQANPNLGYRDVQEILAHSARFVDPGASSWITTHAGTWNGGGSQFSRDYGFGEVDAHGAVRLAEVYPFLHDAPRDEANVEMRTASSGVVTSSSKSTVVLDVVLPAGVDLNHIDLTLNASIANPSTLSVNLTSPSGTSIPMIARPQNVFNSAGSPLPWPNEGFSMGTNAFWGEQSGGTWKITIEDDSTEGFTGAVQSVTLTGYGDAHSTQKEFVYTDDFARIIYTDSFRPEAASRTTLSVEAGETAVINAAAVSSHVTVDLSAHRAEITGQAIEIGPGTVVTKVFTGDGNDNLRGDSGDNSFLAGRGSNIIDGGDGVDTVLYIGNWSSYSVAYDADGTFIVATLDQSTSDIATNVEKATFSEGTLYVQAASDTALSVAGLYEGLLFREADASGYLYWTVEASNGTSLSEISASFLASAEYTSGAALLDNITFLNEVYEHMLDRSVDEGGAAYWIEQLDSGAVDRAGLVISIEQSVEYQSTQLVGVFESINSLGDIWA